MGVATGCGCKEVYRFPHTTYPDIPAFVMYCVNGESGLSLLIESTDSMIHVLTIYWYTIHILLMYHIYMY